jgi:hypothetical protein
MKCYQFILGCAVCLLLVGCRHKQVNKPLDNKENEEAKALLQGIWVDEESDDVSFKAKGDTIYYPDTTSVPVYFKIINDTLVLHGAEVVKYPIVKQAAHIFWFKNQNGDLLKLTKSDDPNDESLFENRHPKPVSVDHVVKRDTVVMHGDERYHCYVYINPTRYKVNKVSYNDDGVEVDNVYYDNIIHISVFHGAEQLYSRDFNKQMFKGMVPDRFLVQSILSNMEFDSVDNSGFHFNATICIPDGASCYMVGITISFKGQMKMELMDY